jgi:hypothetical protein
MVINIGGIVGINMAAITHPDIATLVHPLFGKP